MFDLVKTVTKDKLILHGLYSEGKTNKPAVLFIHGFRTDFYSEDFIIEIAGKLKEKNISFLTVQTRGTASDYAIATSNGKYKRYGSDFELLSEAHFDIDAWIEYLFNKGYKEIVVCGHSLGCLKIARYVVEGKYKGNVSGLILLAPPDNIALTNIHTKGNALKYLKEAYKKIKSKKGEDMIPANYLDVIISYKTYVNWHSEGDLSNIFSIHKKNYKFPVLNKIGIPVMYVVGTKDEFLEMAKVGSAEYVRDILKKYIKNFESHVIKKANHNFSGHELKVAGFVAKFVSKIK